jgi:hypothetical protein
MQIPTSVLSSSYDASSFKRNSQSTTASDVQPAAQPSTSEQVMAAEPGNSVNAPVSASEPTQFAPVSSASQAEQAADRNDYEYVSADSFTSTGNSMTDQYLQIAQDVPVSMASQDPSLFGVDEYV